MRKLYLETFITLTRKKELIWGILKLSTTVGGNSISWQENGLMLVKITSSSSAPPVTRVRSDFNFTRVSSWTTHAKQVYFNAAMPIR